MPLRPTALDCTRLTPAQQNSLYACQTLSLLQSIHLSAYLQSIHPSFYQVHEPDMGCRCLRLALRLLSWALR
jgi:hypothetical protein